MTETVDIQKTVAAPSNVRLSELSTVGLKISDGHIYEESVDELRWPQSLTTYKRMSYDATISAAHNAIKAMIRKVNFRAKLPEGTATEVTELQRDFIQECMGDMEHSFSDFVNETLSMLIYGHSVHEKVYKVRRGLRGSAPSKFEDGRIGWAKLPIRSQDTLYRWNFDDRARRLLSVEQKFFHVRRIFGETTLGNSVTIPRNKFLLFNHDTQRNNPEGTSPLRSCYVLWKYKITMEEIEAIGASRDMRGMPIIELPPDYMSPDADEGKKRVYQWAIDTINNIHNNEQAGIVMPKFVDPETRENIFGFRLEGVTGQGGKSYDTNSIIERYENKILMTYLADVLKMGQTNSGSFALSDNKTNLLAVGIEAVLKEILQVINEDLIPQTLHLNGWDVSGDLPYIGYDDLDERDLEKLGGFIQKVVSVGAMEVDQNLSNGLRELARLPMASEEAPMRESLLPANAQTRASDGMAKPGEGTRDNPSGNATSTANASNNTN